MEAVPRLAGGGIQAGIYGSIPDYLYPPKGCRFAPRCEFACEECQKQRIHLTDLENGRQVRCRRYENV